MQDVIAQLVSIRRRMRLLLIAQRLCVTAGWAVGLLFALVLFDFIARLPAAVRLVQLAGIVALAGWAIWRYLWPAIVFSPTLVALALRLERRLPQLQGRLASGVEFALSGVDRSSALAARAVAEASSRARRENLRRQISRRRALIDLGAALVVICIAAGATVSAPVEAGIGVRRILTPFSGAEWPKRTGVVSLVDADAHPLGVALPLRAEITHGFHPDMRVWATYREISEGESQPAQRIMLTHQRGSIFERLIETDADAIEISFSTEDDRTATQAVKIVPPPAIREARLVIEPPSYALGSVPPIEADLGPGTDQRSVSPQAGLIGSEVRLSLEFNKPIPIPAERDVMTGKLGWGTPGGSPGAPTDLSIEADRSVDELARSIELRWTLSRTVTLSPSLVDVYGIPGPDNIAYRIDADFDKSPMVSITEPVADMSVLPTASFPIAAESRDDVAIERAWMEIRRIDPASRNEPAADSAEPQILVEVTPGATPVEMETMLDLVELEAATGDTFELVAKTQDSFVLNGARHEPVRSIPRRLRIIAASEFVEQIYQDLAAVRDNAIRIEGDQRDLRGQIEDKDLQPGDRVEQARIGERVSRQAETLERIRDRMNRNRFNDPDLGSTIDQAEMMLKDAGEASNEALDRMARAGEQEAGPPKRDELTEEARRYQQEVQRRLTELAQLLDRGEDSWVMRRFLEELLDQQRRLTEQTDELTAQTRGRDVSELSEAERDDLEQFADQQSELAEQAEDLVERLHRRSDELRESDPELSESMERAAEEAARGRLESEMSEASQELRQNQGQNASQSQQAAMNAISQMLRELEQTEKARAERLRRELASIVESLTALIQTQQEQLDVLAAAAGAVAGLDVPMIRLNQNTNGVYEFIMQAGGEVTRVAPLVEEAAEAQEGAIGALRDQPARIDEARADEERSLAKLTEARNLAQQLLEQFEEEAAEQQKEELKRAYRELLTREIHLLDETEPLANKVQLNRRDLMVARQLAERQAGVREDAARVLSDTQGLVEAAAFRLSHEEVDEIAAKVTEQLRRPSFDARVVLWEQDLVDRFAALLAALEEQPDDSEFQQEGGGGGGGSGAGGSGGPQPLIPPVTQLKLLRGLQQSIHRSTRTLDEAGTNLPAEVVDERLKELGTRQTDLIDLSDELLEQLQPQGGGPLDVDATPGEGDVNVEGDEEPRDDATPLPEESP